MAATHAYKVYDQTGQYVASVKSPELGAMIISGSCFGAGASIRYGHKRSDIVWLEGADGNAGDSYDEVALVVYNRIHDRGLAARAKGIAQAALAQEARS